MNGDLIEYERLRKLCSEYNLFLQIGFDEININGSGFNLGVKISAMRDSSKFLHLPRRHAWE